MMGSTCKLELKTNFTFSIRHWNTTFPQFYCYLLIAEFELGSRNIFLFALDLQYELVDYGSEDGNGLLNII